MSSTLASVLSAFPPSTKGEKLKYSFAAIRIHLVLRNDIETTRRQWDGSELFMHIKFDDFSSRSKETENLWSRRALKFVIVWFNEARAEIYILSRGVSLSTYFWAKDFDTKFPLWSVDGRCRFSKVPSHKFNRTNGRVGRSYGFAARLAIIALRSDWIVFYLHSPRWMELKATENFSTTLRGQQGFLSRKGLRGGSVYTGSV